MSIINNLGRVKGDKGYAFIPYVKSDTSIKTTISWNCTDENVAQDKYPEDVIIDKLFFIPYVNADGILSWQKSNNSDKFSNIEIPSPVNIKGERGPIGETNIEVRLYPTLNDIDIKDTSTLYYVGDNGDYTVYVYDDDTDEFRKIGLSSIDLSNYYTKNEVDENFATINYVDSEINEKIANTIDLIDNSIIPKLG